MAEAWRIAEPLGLPEPYEVTEIERRTATILELGLAPVGDALQYLPGEYVLLEDHAGKVPPRSYSIAYVNRASDLAYVLARRAADARDEPLSHE